VQGFDLLETVSRQDFPGPLMDALEQQELDF
jgi:hypothetical protein